MIRRPPRSTQGVSSAASDVYKRQIQVRLRQQVKQMSLLPLFDPCYHMVQTQRPKTRKANRQLTIASAIRSRWRSTRTTAADSLPTRTTIIARTFPCARSRDRRTFGDGRLHRILTRHPKLIEAWDEDNRQPLWLDPHGENVPRKKPTAIRLSTCLLYTSPSPRD